ncbi:hypothetical protein B0H12DRAFT_1120165 [Mycena haematopus]|nr:hypothetical protein B0H12DRAFT_1120165 [Mycena haematopus]
MPVGIEAWVAQIPPITRGWLALSVLTSLAVQCQLVTPLQLYFSPKSFLNGQPWRAGTTFFYFGPISLDFIFHLFFLCVVSRPLPLFNLPFLSSSLAFVPIYLWSRRHPSTPISLFGLITITAPYLPVALVAFSWILNGTWKAAAGDLVGCAVGHVGWFLRDVWTREMLGGTTVFSEAPIRLKRMFGDV